MSSKLVFLLDELEKIIAEIEHLMSQINLDEKSQPKAPDNINKTYIAITGKRIPAALCSEIKLLERIEEATTLKEEMTSLIDNSYPS